MTSPKPFTFIVFLDACVHTSGLVVESAPADDNRAIDTFRSR
jgi:hypothetical protein